MIKTNLLAACVATTMATSTFANVSLSGKYEGKLLNNSGASSYSQKMDLKLVGKDGDTKTVVTFDIDSGSSSPDITVSESYIATKFGYLSAKGGFSKGLTGNGLTFKKSAASNKISVGTNLLGFGIKATQGSGSSATKIDVSKKFNGVAVKFQNVLKDSRTVSVKGSFGGFDADVEHSDSTTAFSLGTEISGVDFAYISIDAGSGLKNIQNDGVFGNISGTVDVDGKSTTTTKASGLVASAATDFGKITGKIFSVEHGPSTTDTAKISIKRGIVSYSMANIDNGTSSNNVFDAKVTFSF